MIFEREGCLYWQFDNETVRVDPWGSNALRVRATKNRTFTEHDWALLPKPAKQAKVKICQEKHSHRFARPYGLITNGKLTAVLESTGEAAFYNQNRKDSKLAVKFT